MRDTQRAGTFDIGIGATIVVLVGLIGAAFGVGAYLAGIKDGERERTERQVVITYDLCQEDEVLVPIEYRALRLRGTRRLHR
jgi:hypothetical protein